MSETKPKRRRMISLLGFMRFAIILGLIALLLGFGLFIQSVKRRAPAPESLNADGIVVLTGPGGGRLEAGAALLKSGAAERLLISGVDKAVTPSQIANILDVQDETMSCCVDLDFAAGNTAGNARETAIWARALGYEHLIIVTSDYHMPRAMSELSHATNGMRLTRYPVPDKREEGRFGVLAREYGKLLVIYTRQMGDRRETAPQPDPAPVDVMRDKQADTDDANGENK
ncbi:YdcF family protein [Robiginitomaculum antarcticum]|uniref:YdcF family protein n=1 Tax=Robiginitomaculum antarcticum TaxID=437507 RepID=UPI000362B6C4|nr:YdcF family protein [Robiginitomaculum antarcticum]